MNVPTYLAPYADLWQRDPHQAALTWFQNANYGLFIHYGLYSQLGRGEWVQYREQIPLAEYEKLADSFTAKKFDADFITDLALEAEMKYINLTSCHHESFCLWDSRAEPFNSKRSPAGRDLVAEMAEQCQKKGLGFFTYYTYMLNWRHPYFLSRETFEMARPAYPQPEARYRLKNLAEFQIYIEYIHACMRELLSRYGALAGMWLDIISAYYALPDLVPVRDTYALIRQLQPQALISFKQGATGDEDFATPEQKFHSLEERARQAYGERAAQIARAAWQKNKDKHNEICATLQKGAWGYDANAQHLSAGELWSLLGSARGHNCNLLANIGPLPAGEVHPDDIAALRAVGKRIRAEGWPEAGDSGSALQTGAQAV